MKYVHYYLKFIVPTFSICAIILCCAECLKHGSNGLAIAAAIAALSGLAKIYYENQDNDGDNDVKLTDEEVAANDGE